MTANRPLHALLGIIMLVTGFVCHFSEVPPRGPYYLILALFGTYWAIVPGHLPLLLEPLIKRIAFPFIFPFRLLRYYTKCPVRYKKGEVIGKYGWTVFGYHAKEDHVFLVAGRTPISLSSSSLFPFAYEEYRHSRVIEKTIDMLSVHGVPEVSMDASSVTESFGKILTDPRLEDCFGFFDQEELSYTPEQIAKLDHFGQIERFFRRFPKEDEWIIEKFLQENRISICTLKVGCRYVGKDPFWPEPRTTMDKILYKWWI